MKPIVAFSAATAALLLLSHAAAATTFVIGNEPFELEFETNPTNEAFRTFVAEDVSRVFAPLGSVSNVVDIASLQQHPELSRGLTLHEWYPEGFSGGWSVTNRNGMLVFRMSASLSSAYSEAFHGFNAISNRVAELEELMESLNDGTITNRPDEQIVSLVFVPENSALSFTSEDVRTFFGDMSRSGPFAVSILDHGIANIRGDNYPVAVAKTIRHDENDVQFVPITWIFRNGCWAYCHPAVFESVTK